MEINPYIHMPVEYFRKSSTPYSTTIEITLFQPISKHLSLVTSFLCCTKEDLFNKLLGRISIRIRWHKPFHMVNHLFIGKILIKTIWWEYQIMVFRTQSMVTKSRCAGDVWRSANKINSEDLERASFHFGCNHKKISIHQTQSMMWSIYFIG